MKSQIEWVVCFFSILHLETRDFFIFNLILFSSFKLNYFFCSHVSMLIFLPTQLTTQMLTFSVGWKNTHVSGFLQKGKNLHLVFPDVSSSCLRPFFYPLLDASGCFWVSDYFFTSSLFSDLVSFDYFGLCGF
jgi:hypothetical protein